MKPYQVTPHAIERAVERLGLTNKQSKAHIVDIMQSAAYQGMTASPRGLRRVYDHYRTRTRMILDEKQDVVITVFSMDTDKDGNPVERVPIASATNNAIIAAAHATIQRELAKARRIFTSELRKLKIEQAELGVEIAQATVNKARCMAPHTQALIQERIDAMQTYYDVVGAKIAKESAEYSRVKTEAQAFIGAEVSV